MPTKELIRPFVEKKLDGAIEKIASFVLLYHIIIPNTVK